MTLNINKKISGIVAIIVSALLFNLAFVQGVFAEVKTENANQAQSITKQGVDGKSNPTSINPTKSTVTDFADVTSVKSEQQNIPSSNQSDKQSINANYQHKSFTVLDSSELTLDGSGSLVITFSVPLQRQQDFNHLIRLVDNESGYINGDFELSDNGLEIRHRYLPPNRQITVNIDKSLLAINGKRLDHFYKATIKTENRKPLVGFKGNGYILPLHTMSGLPVNTLNVNKIDVNFYRIKPEKFVEFLTYNYDIKSLSVWNRVDMNQYIDLVYTSRFELKPKANAFETVLLDLTPINELKKAGVYLAIINQAGQFTYSNPATIFTISNIGLSAHEYENDHILVSAHSLDKGLAKADITLTLLCEKNNANACQKLETKTDKQGFAKFAPAKNSHYRVLLASDNQQTSFIYLNQASLDLSDFTISGQKFAAKQLFAFTARDLYRPKETVFINALLRNADGQMVANQPIKVDVIDASGQKYTEFVWQPETNQLGFYQKQLILPENAPLGKWSFRFNLGDDDYRYYYFNVEDFLPERMGLTISSATERPITKDQNVSFDIKGWYLYGAPASGNRLDANIYLKKNDKYDNFTIGSVNTDISSRQIDHHQSTLNGAGTSNISIDNQNWQTLDSPIDVILQASLLDDGGMPITRVATQTIWPATALPGIRALFGNAEHYDWKKHAYLSQPTIVNNAAAEFEIAYINNDGKKLATQDLVVKFIRERNDFIWTWTNEEGWDYTLQTKEFEVYNQSLVIKEGSTTSISYLASEEGQYRIEVLDTQNKVVSSMHYWVGFNDYDNSLNSNNLRPDQIKITLDKAAYNTFDIAKVHIESPISGSGFLMLETNDGELWKQAISIDDKPIDVEIPIQNWARHDVYVHAFIIRPSTDVVIKMVKRAIGISYLPINIDRKLAITLEANAKTEPNSTLPVKIKVDKHNQTIQGPITVLVSAVDEGVLTINQFKTPDPYTAFLGRKRYNVDLFDVYGKLIEANGRSVNMRFGGDAMLGAANGGGKLPLTHYNIVSMQLAPVQLNNNGEALIELKLPDFNGQLRLMAQAWTDYQFGHTEKALTVSAPVVAELLTPRFLAGGDKSILSLELNNLTDNIQTIDVAINVNGLLKLDGELPSTIQLKPKQRKVMRIPVIANNGFGEGNIHITGTNIMLENNRPYKIDRNWSIAVRPASVATIIPYNIEIKPANSWQLPFQDINSIVSDTLQGNLVISTYPPLNISQYIQSLFAYPYGCLEQIISGLYPSLYGSQANLVSLGIKTDSDPVRHVKVQQGIDRILAKQRINGSFGLWSNQSEEEYWLTVYATDFLLNAKERGYQVNQRALNRALKRLNEYVYDNDTYQYLSEDTIDHHEQTVFAVKAYAIMILSQQNKITPAVRNEIKRLAAKINANADFAFSPLPVAQLAIAAKLVGFDEIVTDLLPKVLTIKRASDNFWVQDYGSKVRDEARLLALLIDNKLLEDKQAQMLINFTQSIQNNRYFSTQELNALFLLAWTLQDKQNKSPFIVNINHVSHMNESLLRKFYTDNLVAQGLTISNLEADKSLYINFTLSGYPKVKPDATPPTGMLTIVRSYYDLAGNPITPETLNVGDQMMVILDVNAKQPIHDALIVDLLPAGLGLENPQLSDQGGLNLNTSKINKLVNDENPIDLKYQEYRDDRYVAAVDINQYKSENNYSKRVAYVVRAITLGDYNVPAPSVSSMYRPEWFAIGQTLNHLTIKEQTPVPVQN